MSNWKTLKTLTTCVLVCRENKAFREAEAKDRGGWRLTGRAETKLSSSGHCIEGKSLTGKA